MRMGFGRNCRSQPIFWSDSPAEITLALSNGLQAGKRLTSEPGNSRPPEFPPVQLVQMSKVS